MTSATDTPPCFDAGSGAEAGDEETVEAALFREHPRIRPQPAFGAGRETRGQFLLADWFGFQTYSTRLVLALLMLERANRVDQAATRLEPADRPLEQSCLQRGHVLD